MLLIELMLPEAARIPLSTIHDLIREQIAPHYARLAELRSTIELEQSPLYRRIEPHVREVLCSIETGSWAHAAAPAKDRYRVLAWNIERGARLEGQLQAFREHPYLRDCDVLLLSEVDVGMARSGNRHVARELACQLGMHYAFVPCYLSLVKGSGLERKVQGDNDLGLHGNAILSRYPICRPRILRLRNGIDKMAGREKRLGSQAVVITEVRFPNYHITAACVHLDAQSTQRHRRDQMRAILDAVEENAPVLLGGDWNSTTYNSSRAFHAIMGFWLRVMMGVDNVITNHYLHPYSRFERELFDLLEARGFDYRECNIPGEYTISYSVDDPRARQSLGDWVPWWCFAFIRWALRNHGGKCPLKIDWFASRGMRTLNPTVIHDIREGRAVPLSDHDAIGLEITVAQSSP
jgi:endonuclease/exonuclease/phosphatase family metal-dependent hydrolase